MASKKFIKCSRRHGWVGKRNLTLQEEEEE